MNKIIIWPINSKLPIFFMFLYSLIRILNWSMLSEKMNTSFLVQIPLFLLIICLFINLSKEKFHINLIIIVLTILGVIISNFDGMTNYFTIILVIIGLSNEDIMPYAKAIYYATIIGIIMVLMLRLINFIPDLVSYSPRGAVRHSLGFKSPRGISEQYFVFCQLFIFIKYEKIKKIWLLALILPFLPLYFLSDARGTIILAILMVILILIDKKNKGKAMLTNVFYIISKLTYIVMFLLIILCSYFYNQSSVNWIKIDNLVSGRFRLGHYFIINFPPKLFGQWLPLNVDKDVLWLKYGFNYLMLDSGYMTMLLEAGIIISIIMSFIIFIALKRLKNQRDNRSLILWIILGLDLFQTRPLNPAAIQVLQLSNAFKINNKKLKNQNVTYSEEVK